MKDKYETIYLMKKEIIVYFSAYIVFKVEINTVTLIIFLTWYLSVQNPSEKEWKANTTQC